MVNVLSLAIVEFFCDLIPDLPDILAISSSYVTTIEDLKLHLRRIITLHLLSGCIEKLDPANSTKTTLSKHDDFSFQKIAFDFDRAMTKNCSIRHHGSSSGPTSDSTTSQKENSGIDSTGLSSASGNGETIPVFSQEIGPPCSFACRPIGVPVIIDDKVQPLSSEPILSDTLRDPAGLNDASGGLESLPNFGFCQPRRSSEDEPEDQYSSESFATQDRSENDHRTISAALDHTFQRPRIIDMLTGMGDEHGDAVLGSPNNSSLLTGKSSEDEHFISRVINSRSMNPGSEELASRENRSAANNDYLSHLILAGNYLGVQPTGDRIKQDITQTAPPDLKDGNKRKYCFKLFDDIETPAKSRWTLYRENLDFNCGVYLEEEQADCFNDRADVLSSGFLDDNYSRNKMVDPHSDSIHFLRGQSAYNCRSSFTMPGNFGIDSSLRSESASEFGVGSRSRDAGRPLFCGFPLPNSDSKMGRSNHRPVMGRSKYRPVMGNSTRTEIPHDKFCIPDPQRAAFWRSENTAQMQKFGADQLANRWRTTRGSLHDGSLCQTESESRLRGPSRVGQQEVSWREDVCSHMDEETADCMVFVSWIPKQTRAYNSIEKPRIEMELISRLRESLKISGLNRIILFPPKGAHCKLVFKT